MELLEQGAEWLAEQRRSALAVPIKYCREESTVISLPATIGHSRFRSENQYGVRIRNESRDFIISASDLPFTPSRGDVILYAGKRYEVLAPNGEAVWRWSGNGHVSRRIHTKDTGDDSDDE